MTDRNKEWKINEGVRMRKRMCEKDKKIDERESEKKN